MSRVNESRECEDESVLPTLIVDDDRLVKAAGGFLNVAIIAPA
jgi:hypothetical protein